MFFGKLISCVIALCIAVICAGMVEKTCSSWLPESSAMADEQRLRGINSLVRSVNLGESFCSSRSMFSVNQLLNFT